jgi:lysophospholipase L1-like esterase
MPAAPMKRSRILLALSLAVGAAVLTSTGCAVWRIGQAAELARQSEPWQQRPSNPTLRLLIVGDSTGVGTGATSGRGSLAGLIGAAQPRWWIDNRARDGARFRDLTAQLEGSEHFDIVLVQAGGNDVIRLSGMQALQRDIELVAGLARARGDRVILMPAGNVGNAPFFFAPLSWLMTERSRALHRVVKEAAGRIGADYVNLFHERAEDPFVLDPQLNARDGLHPSDAGYKVWLQALQAQADVPRRVTDTPR